MARSSEYTLRKRFVTDSETIQSSNGVTSFDDPTYLGFNIIFDRMSPLFNKETSSHGESALSYLKQVDKTRAQYLETFIDGWLQIADTRSYYYQEIEGLDEIWSNNVGGGDPFKGSAVDAGVKVKCLEAIDLKMTALLSLYREACYDNKYRRIVLPENLRHFNVMVQVLEVRNFRKVIRKLSTTPVTYVNGDGSGSLTSDARFNNLNNSAGNSGQSESEINELNFVNENTSVVSFHLAECEFHTNSGSEMFSAGQILNNGANTFVGTSFGFNYANMSEVNNFSGLNYTIDGNKKTQTDSQIAGGGTNVFGNETSGSGLSFKEKVGNFVDDKVDQVKTGLGSIKGQIQSLGNQFGNIDDRLLQAANTIAQRIALGNVYGLRNQLRSVLSNPQAIANIAVGGAVAAANEFGGSVSDQVESLGGNLFEGQVTPQSVANDLGDILNQAPPGPEPLSGDENVYDR